MATGASRRIAQALKGSDEADERAEALWELRPVERLRSNSPGSKIVEADSRPKSLCMMPLFGGCTLCAAHDDEIVRPHFERIGEEHWEPADLLCSSVADRRCGVTEEYAEEVEESASTLEGEDAVVAAETLKMCQGPPALLHRDHGGAPQETPLLKEVETLMWVVGDFFLSRGWLLEALGGDRFRLNGRSVKLSLLPFGVPLMPFNHLLCVVHYEMAEHAARFVVSDGSLRQPLLDYLLQTGQNECYDERGTENIAGVEGPGRFLDFNIRATEDRILEMKCAKIQADMRRSAGAPLAGPARASALQSEGAKLLGNRGQHGGLLLRPQQLQGAIRGV